eukprot:2586733-Rhodomonas_salina.1
MAYGGSEMAYGGSEMAYGGSETAYGGSEMAYGGGSTIRELLSNVCGYQDQRTARAVETRRLTGRRLGYGDRSAGYGDGSGQSAMVRGEKAMSGCVVCVPCRGVPHAGVGWQATRLWRY